ncbi:hypothetical protein BT63DRAFT_467877 [Microthyrium microscopicum]|uniref:Archaemetzincin-2 n=1 Tax=Microthyrium microscopicum TaxID=703497 RepID=A0A6A6ULI5_9PEZI|nr:hypothetical protein BT63DRAFT_467877 [Microthyrium microscopicum]
MIKSSAVAKKSAVIAVLSLIYTAICEVKIKRIPNQVICSSKVIWSTDNFQEGLLVHRIEHLYCFPMLRHCSHSAVQFEPSQEAIDAGFDWQSESERAKAAGTIKAEKEYEIREGNPEPGTKLKWSRQSKLPDEEPYFPAPVLLTRKEVESNQNCPYQSLENWIASRSSWYRHPDKENDPEGPVASLESWIKPQFESQEQIHSNKFDSDDLFFYLKDFYYPRGFKLIGGKLGLTLHYRHTVDELLNDRGCIGMTWKEAFFPIRYRECPDRAYMRQLNADDLLQACIQISMDGDGVAGTLMLIVDFDLYGNDESIPYYCGRTNKKMRVSVVSTARYHPALDTLQKVSREHSWPASHCRRYISKAWANEDVRMDEGDIWSSQAEYDEHQELRTPKAVSDWYESMPAWDPEKPLERSLETFKSLASIEVMAKKNPCTLENVWLARVARRASHELGHCFGFHHCAYYACLMQKSTSIAEELRQAPYLCLVCGAKLARLGPIHSKDEMFSLETERYEKMVAGLEGYLKLGDCHNFHAHRAFLKQILFMRRNYDGQTHGWNLVP